MGEIQDMIDFYGGEEQMVDAMSDAGECDCLCHERTYKTLGFCQQCGESKGW